MANLDLLLHGTTIKLHAHVDPVVDVLGHDPRSDYAERFWLPVLGPSTTFLLRLFAERLDQQGEGCLLDVAETARCLGLGERSGRHGPFLRTIGRAVDFDMAVVRGENALATRLRLPPLSRRHLLRLPPSLARLHEDYDRDRVANGLDHQRARRLALSLLQLGESRSDIERQLVRWRFSAEVARTCATWAEHTTSSATSRSPAAATPCSQASQRPTTNLVANGGLSRSSR